MIAERVKTFNDYLAFGRIAEGQIAQWLVRARGYHILPAYEIEIPSGKGPVLFSAQGKLIAPDLLAINGKDDIRWIEAKHKTRFTWHRNSGNWQTGIDIRHYEDYCKVLGQTKIDVWVLFLHICKAPSQSDLDNGSPQECPVGLFGRSLAYLQSRFHHKDSYGKGGRDYPMVYWNEQSLMRIATLEEVQAVSQLEASV